MNTLVLQLGRSIKLTILTMHARSPGLHAERAPDQHLRLVLPDGVHIEDRSPQEQALYDCFRVYRPVPYQVRETVKNRYYQSHQNRIITFTARGAGGTAKTSSAWTTGYALLQDGEEDQVGG